MGSLEPTDFNSSNFTGPLNPHAIQQHGQPDQATILETQSFVRNNPGPYEDLHKKARELQPMPFEGLKLVMNRGLSSHFQVSHSLNISNEASRYAFNSTYAGGTEYRIHENSPLLMGEIDGQGGLSAQIIQNFNKNLRARVIVNDISPMQSGMQADVNYFGRRFCLTGVLVNPSIKNRSGMLFGQFTHRLTDNIDVGAEAVAQFTNLGKNFAQTGFMYSVAARYSSSANHTFSKPSPFGIVYPSSKWTAAGTLGVTGFHLSYQRHVAEGLQVGVNTEFSRAMGQGLASFSYALDLFKHGCTVKSSIDNTFSVSTVLEKRSSTFPVCLALCVDMKRGAGKDGASTNTSVGIGCTIG